jgi:adenine phosphoribosyltransferase
MKALNIYLKTNGHSDYSPRYIVSVENGIYDDNGCIKDICIVLVKDRVTSKIYTNEETVTERAIVVPGGDKLFNDIKSHPVFNKNKEIIGYDTTMGSLLAFKYNVSKNNWMGQLAGVDRKVQIMAELDTIWPTVMRETIMSHVRLIPGFPNEKVLFQDYMPLQYEFTTRTFLTHLINEEIPEDIKFDIVAGPETRGIMFGKSLADLLKIGFIPLRKKGKLPPPTLTKSYDTEYDDNNTLEIDNSEANPIKTMKDINPLNVVLVDDVKGTGGSLKAAIDLIEEVGGKVVYWVTVNDVVHLREQADKVLEGYPGSVIFKESS